MSDVFIAHVEEDAEVALEIGLGLEQAGYSTWCYEVDSIPGPSYLIQTGQAVEQAKVVVLVVSPHSVGSRQVTKEVIRAHESGKEFIPLLRGITHIEFQNRQPEWREAVGAAASISIPPEGVADILPRIIDRLKALGIQPRMKANPARIAQIRKALSEPPAPARKPEPEAIAAEIPTAKAAEEARGRQKWIWLALIASAIIALSVMGVIFLAQPEPTPPTPPPTPTPTPSPTPEVQPPAPLPRLMYEDDFSNPGSGWLRESTEAHEFDYENGEYHVLVKKSNWAAWAWNGDAGPFTDFTLETDARLISGPNQSLYGVVFRLQDSENFYRFLVSGDGYYLVGARLNGNWTVLQSKTKSAFIKEGNSTNHLKVVCRSSQIEVAVNGHHLTTVTDDSFAVGVLGMIVDTPEANTCVAFDNIRVYSLD